MNRIRGEGGRFHSGSLKRMNLSSSKNMQNDNDCNIRMDNHSYHVTIKHQIEEEQNLQSHNGLVYSISG